MNTVNQRKSEAVEGLKAILTTNNCMGVREDELGVLLAQALIKEHRTIQQTFMRTLVSMMGEYAKESGSDLRNEGSVKLALDIATTERALPPTFTLIV